jgi:hypothetical protein
MSRSRLSRASAIGQVKEIERRVAALVDALCTAGAKNEEAYAWIKERLPVGLVGYNEEMRWKQVMLAERAERHAGWCPDAP